MKPLFLGIAERLMRCPAVPYHEKLVATEIVRICQENDLRHEFDPFGNLLVRASARTAARPIVLAAHMDHPGFVMEPPVQPGKLIGRFHGGVADSYFKAGTKLLLMPGRVRAALGDRLSAKRRDFRIRTTAKLSVRPEFAVWDLPEFRFSRGRIVGRVCDDLIGVATVLAVLISLRGTKAASHAVGVLSRAEEVGFHGALALAESKRLPRQSLIISLETSRELPPVQMGRGVIIRVGDRASIFDSAATRFLTEVAAGLKQRKSTFDFQRALMSGGTCEGTAYQEYGYQTAAVCVALGNYHNCGPKGRIGTEFVSLADALSMAALLGEACRELPKYAKFTNRLPKRLSALARQARRELRKTVPRIG